MLNPSQISLQLKTPFFRKEMMLFAIQTSGFRLVEPTARRGRQLERQPFDKLMIKKSCSSCLPPHSFSDGG
jgi:hypothetical protein